MYILLSGSLVPPHLPSLQKTMINQLVSLVNLKVYISTILLAIYNQCFIFSDIVQKIQNQLSSADIGRLFVVLHVDSNQRKVTTEDILILRKHIQAEVGERIVLNKVHTDRKLLI